MSGRTAWHTESNEESERTTKREEKGEKISTESADTTKTGGGSDIFTSNTNKKQEKGDEHVNLDEKLTTREQHYAAGGLVRHGCCCRFLRKWIF